MTTTFAPNCDAAWLALLKPTSLELLLRLLSGSQLRMLLDDWPFWARGEQRASAEAWRTWVFMGGRGAGKTRAGAEWIAERVRAGCRRLALIGPTLHDVREVMIEGHSGLLSLERSRPRYEPSRRRLSWPNGAQALCFSAEDPESLRGPQFDAAWADELCYWRYADEALSALAHALRLGASPQLMVTTTPRPTTALKQLLAAPDTVTSNAVTWSNHVYLARDFLAAMNRRWDGAAVRRQELLGDLIEDVAGALWTRAALEAMAPPAGGGWDRIVVGVDPPAGVGATAATCGIVAAAARGDGLEREAAVLADASVQGAAPHVWAARVAELARAVGAHAIVAEANNGGEMVRAVLKAAAAEYHVRLVRASEGKRARAEPIAAFYARGRVAHASRFPALEDEMCAFGAEGFKGSPDRVDALVWALTDLMVTGGAQPRVRVI